MDTKALFKLSYGLYVIGVKNPDNFGGCVIDALVQATSGETPRIIICCMNANNTPARISETGEFTVSVLGKAVDPFVLSNFGFQSGRDTDKWANVPYSEWHGLPTLDGATAHLYCKVEDYKEYDTHKVFTCTVEDAKLGADDSPLLYADYFTDYKSKAAAAFASFKETGVVPAKTSEAPIKEAAADSDGGKWVCSVCGYIYDGETPFEELPDSWTCPLCGVPKSMFKKQ